MFSQSMFYLFIFLMVCLNKHKFYILIMSNLSIFLYSYYHMCPKKSLPNPKSQSLILFYCLFAVAFAASHPHLSHLLLN